MGRTSARRARQVVRLLLAFAGGILSGLLLAYGMETWVRRDGLPGGEALILPLIVLLIYLGWQLGRVWCER